MNWSRIRWNICTMDGWIDGWMDGEVKTGLWECLVKSKNRFHFCKPVSPYFDRRQQEVFFLAYFFLSQILTTKFFPFYYVSSERFDHLTIQMNPIAPLVQPNPTSATTILKPFLLFKFLIQVLRLDRFIWSFHIYMKKFWRKDQQYIHFSHMT